MKRFAILLGALCFTSLTALPAAAQTATSPATAGNSRRDFRSPHFLLHTDLAPTDAQELLKKLETMIALVSKYWGRPPAGVIECYVVQNLDLWPDGTLDPRGRAKIAEGAGVTMTEALSLDGRIVAAKSVVYATSARGTAQHEAVHAYCGQTFGTTGPVWYAEGMAEMGQYWREGDSAVNCHPEVLDYLRSSAPKSLREIIEPNQFTGDSWQNYAWRWALCHLLANNPNYSPRFRPLGQAILASQPVTFEQTYGAMASEISFEYLFFLQHVAQGYRVDLCSWDWKRKFVALTPGTSISATVNSGRGWQPAGLQVTGGEAYEFTATGTWQCAKDATPVSAAGNDQGEGKLWGVLIHEFKLSEPFELGAQGTWRPESAGKLYLRCHDAWHELADNKGTVTVRWKRPK